MGMHGLHEEKWHFLKMLERNKVLMGSRNKEKGFKSASVNTRAYLQRILNWEYKTMRQIN